MLAQPPDETGWAEGTNADDVRPQAMYQACGSPTGPKRTSVALLQEITLALARKACCSSDGLCPCVLAVRAQGSLEVDDAGAQLRHSGQ